MYSFELKDKRIVNLDAIALIHKTPAGRAERPVRKPWKLLMMTGAATPWWVDVDPDEKDDIMGILKQISVL